MHTCTTCAVGLPKEAVQLHTVHTVAVYTVRTVAGSAEDCSAHLGLPAEALMCSVQCSVQLLAEARLLIAHCI